jgi:PAS domain S-box-containing protein
LNATGLREDQIVGKDVREVIPEPSLTLVLHNYEQAIRENKTTRWEEVTNYPSGTKCGEVTVTPVLDAHGQCTNLVGSVHDITERKEAQEKIRRYSENLEAIVKERTKDLQSTKDQLEHVVELNPAVTYIAKPLPNFRYYPTYMSKNVASLVGFEAEKFIGPEAITFWESRVHPEDLARYKAETPQLWKDKYRSSEYRFLRKDGEYCWIREEINVIRDSAGNDLDIIGLWTDVTDRKQAEAVEEKRKAELSKKLNDITDRLDSLAKTREKLKTVPDISTGLDAVLETVLWDFGLDCGAVLVIDRKASNANVRAAKARSSEMVLNQSYPLGEFAELKDLQEKSVTRTFGREEQRILGTEVIHIVPIRAAREIYGVLILGNEKGNSLDEHDVRILEQYAELVYSFMIERSMSLTPVLEVKPERGISGLATSIEPGEMYLFKKNPADAFEVFANAVFAGHQGLCITRMYPPKLRSKYGLQKTPIVWLTDEATEGEQCVYSMQDLSILVGDYLAKAEKAVVLVDGFEYLITNHGFDAFLRLLQILKNRVQRRNGILIASVFAQALAPRDLALIEREMKLFGR